MRGDNLRSSERMAAPSGWDPEAQDLLLLFIMFYPFKILFAH